MPIQPDCYRKIPGKLSLPETCKAFYADVGRGNETKSMKYLNVLEDLKHIENGYRSTIGLWTVWEHRFKTRKQLHALLLNDPDHLHSDLGLSTEEVLEEIRKPFWR